MDLNLSAAVAALPANAAFRIANEARPDGAYLFNTLLPERNVPSYHVDMASMTIRATMAGLVGMDSPYPPGGLVDLSKFFEQTAKIANEIQLNEATMRQLHDLVLRLQAQGQPTVATIQENLLNFLDKVVVQPHLDRFEWLRGQALVTGAIDWTFNNKQWQVGYGVPADNFLTNRTGNDAYDGSTSKFWDDIATLRRVLRNNVRAFIVHGTTADVIRFNPANSIATTGEIRVNDFTRRLTLRRINQTNGGFSADVGDIVELIAYDAEAEIIDPATPGSTLILPFMTVGKVLGIGNNASRTFRVGTGGTNNPDEDNALGYTHIAPTIEGGGRAGRWSDLLVPQERPWQTLGRAVTNGIPVIENPNLIAVASTDMP